MIHSSNAPGRRQAGHMPTGHSRRDVALVQRQLAAVIADALRLEERHRSMIDGLPRRVRSDARNLLHYLALRSQDRRPLQRRLAELGLSSLGRSEAHVMATLTATARAAAALAGVGTASRLAGGIANGQRRLRRAGRDLLGAAANGREVRIMVTLPEEAGRSRALVRDLIDGGMDIARINCAHDDDATWRAMASMVRAVARQRRRVCLIAMELAGPKLRTVGLAGQPGVVRWKPQRDALGRTTAPARVALAAEFVPCEDRIDAVLPVGILAAGLRRGDRLGLTDTRGRRRHLLVISHAHGVAVAECRHGAHIIEGAALRVRRGHHVVATGLVHGLPPGEVAVRLRSGDRLILGRPPQSTAAWLSAPRFGCTLPLVFSMVRAGERVVFDDGRLAGVVRAANATGVAIEVTTAPADGAMLRGDKGINLPDTDLHLPALTKKDHADLEVAGEIADVVGLSFVREADDVRALHAALPNRRIGVIVKIETGRAFAALPRILLAALARPPAGVMIARGDLAAEIGFERLAEVQEEILWLSEAARIPVIWATQVLERLAKKGVPTRAEVTDAAMSGRAECVMINKGPYIRAVLPFLSGVLTRMEAHQDKKQSMLRRLAVSASLEQTAVRPVRSARLKDAD